MKMVRERERESVCVCVYIFIYNFFFPGWLHHAVYGISVPQPGIEPSRGSESTES